MAYGTAVSPAELSAACAGLLAPIEEVVSGVAAGKGTDTLIAESCSRVLLPKPAKDCTGVKSPLPRPL